MHVVLFNLKALCCQFISDRFHDFYSKHFLFILQKEIHDLKVQLTSTAEKEQNYLKQLMTLNTDLEQEAYDNF